MKISGIDNLDIGMSNIEIEGEVTYTMLPRNITGENEKGHYDFWSQFVVIEDGTGKIGCNVSIEKEEYKLAKGVVARVKGKLEEYKDKKGEMVRKLQGKLIAISKGDKVTDVQLETAEEYFEEKAKEEKQASAKTAKENVPASVWEEKDLRIARECAIKAVTELVCAKIMVESKEDFFTFANIIVKYIYNGIPEKPKEKKPEPTKEENLALARHIVGGSRLELREGQSGLMDDDEEIADEDIPGSSYNNAIEFTGKKKALKPISKAEDFISQSDMPD